MIRNILFDLDGTLLPMDMDEFTGGYFKALVKKAMPYGYDPNELIKTIWAGVKAMVMNDTNITNEEAFWNKFAEIYGEDKRKDRVIFDEFYKEDFICAKEFTGYNPKAKETVEAIKKAGYSVTLATNPIFPETATVQRVSWTGMSVEDFEYFTTYENSTSCKPNPKYYLELLDKLSFKPEECLMVGNDVEEDMEAGIKAGLNVFLITDCMINKNGLDINKYPHGSFDDLKKYLGV